MAQATQKRFRVPEMEGASARWYARLRGSDSQLREYREQAARLTGGLPDGAHVLEVAPGPGYHAIEMARSGRLRVTTLDISRTFVEIAAEHARRAGVPLDVRLGDASEMPFPDGDFDLVVCQAAFKNFLRPADVLDEMHRVLRPGGVAVIQDLNKRATAADIAAGVREMRVGPVSAFVTRRTLRLLRRRAYTPEQFERLAAGSAFHGGEVSTDGVGLEVRLTRT